MDSYGSSSLFPHYVDSVIRGFGRGEEPSGANVLRLIQNPLERSLEKITPACQARNPQPRIADSSSRKAVSFSSAGTKKRFPSSRCASASQIVRPLESIAETQPQLQPALLRLRQLLSFVARRGICLCSFLRP